MTVATGDGTPPPPLPYQSLNDLECLAAERLDADTWSYLTDVAEDGRTHAREKAVLEQIVLRQRGLGDGGTVGTSTSLLGQALRLPVLAAPTSGQAFVHADAEPGMVRGCAQAGTLAVVPMTGSTRQRPAWCSRPTAADNSTARRRRPRSFPRWPRRPPGVARCWPTAGYGVARTFCA
jgi:isopentenyl diphosphate isomerase/L-lactate dehydrogenase-like FMN-dependent dehydrogenase